MVGKLDTTAASNVSPAGMPVGDRLRNRLRRGGLASIALKASNAALSLSVTSLLARNLGPGGYGVYAYVFALVSLASVPAQFGLPNLLVRETAKGQVSENWGLVRGLWRWTSAAAGAFSVGIALVALAAAFLLSDRFSDLQLRTFLWGLLLVPLIVLGNLRGAALRGLQRVVLGQLPELVLRPALLILLVVAYVASEPAGVLDSATAMALYALAALLAFLVGAWLLARHRPAALAQRPAPEYEPRAWVMSAIPLALVASMHLVNGQADIIMLGFFRSAEEVGIYRVVTAGAALVVFALSVVNMVFAPQLARLHALGDRDTLQRVVTSGSRVAFLVGLPALILLVLFGKNVLALLFGDEFVAGYGALVILGAGQLVNAAMGSVGVLLNMTGQERQTARAVAVSAVANVCLNLALIPLFGIIGAAVATFVSLTVWNVLMWRSAFRILGIESAAFRIRTEGNDA